MDASIDLRQLRYFLAVSEELNFGRAAERLHISQPPLSRQIRQLEDQLGVELFLRSSVGVTLTEAGTAFLPEVRLTLVQAQRALAVARAARGAASRRFVVGYTTVVDRSALPDVFDRFQQRFPDWQHVVKGKHSINLIRDVKNGSMDVAFIGLHTETQGLNVETVHEEPVVVAVPSAHPLAKKRRLTLDDLRDEPMFRFERRLNPGYFDYCQSFFRKNNFVPNSIPEPPDHHVLLGLISEAKGVALIPTSLQAVKRPGVVFRPFKDAATALNMGVAVAYSEVNSSPLLRPFLELVRTVR